MEITFITFTSMLFVGQALQNWNQENSSKT